MLLIEQYGFESDEILAFVHDFSVVGLCPELVHDDVSAIVVIAEHPFGADEVRPSEELHVDGVSVEISRSGDFS